jgi:hypothetical protein
LATKIRGLADNHIAFVERIDTIENSIAYIAAPLRARAASGQYASRELLQRLRGLCCALSQEAQCSGSAL